MQREKLFIHDPCASSAKLHQWIINSHLVFLAVHHPYELVKTLDLGALAHPRFWIKVERQKLVYKSLSSVTSELFANLAFVEFMQTNFAAKVYPIYSAIFSSAHRVQFRLFGAI